VKKGDNSAKSDSIKICAPPARQLGAHTQTRPGSLA
jgi:hypothetical protein